MGIYGWEKLVCGLVDLAVYAGYELGPRPCCPRSSWPRIVRRDPPGTNRQRLRRARARRSHLSGTRCQRICIKGYLASGDEALAEFARLWHYDAYWDSLCLTRPVTRQSWDVPVWLHAYSHVNTLSSAAAVYDVYHEPRYI